jgi:hypothetical protein
MLHEEPDLTLKELRHEALICWTFGPKRWRCGNSSASLGGALKKPLHANEQDREDVLCPLYGQIQQWGKIAPGGVAMYFSLFRRDGSRHFFFMVCGEQVVEREAGEFG